MKASFDGARRNLATAYMELYDCGMTVGQCRSMQHLRDAIVALLCMYDPTTMPADGNDLSELSDGLNDPYEVTE